MYNIKDLQTRGFVVVPNFLNSDELAVLQDDYQQQKSQPIKNKNYAIVPGTKYSLIQNKIQQVMALVRENTNLTVDVARPLSGYFDTTLTEFGWHVDHEPYFRHQDSYNAVNFWIPIVKPRADSSGLCVVPFDTMSQLDPVYTQNQLVGKGAKLFYTDGDQTRAVDDAMGTTTVLPYVLDDLAVEPACGAGDLVLMRNDVIHRTQDTLDHRVAVSVRCYNGDGIVTRDQFEQGSAVKQQMIQRNPNGFKDIIEKFTVEKRDSFLIKELYKQTGH
jgi:ectoine hydroxylase-related dioxygenase (phytanoyl-CoA dioxygenase family)